ncbi:hypothetical protein N9T93_01275, partial [Flavobacteriaceae bacterium]|nr:hypothetical protein [Flavobacteriaceae bacterium]
MKKIGVLFVFLFLSIGFTFAQKPNIDRSEKFYSKNWKSLKTNSNSAWSNLKPSKKDNTINSSKSSSISSIDLKSKSRKINKKTYPNSSNKTLLNKTPSKAGKLLTKKSTINSSKRLPAV